MKAFPFGKIPPWLFSGILLGGLAPLVVLFVVAERGVFAASLIMGVTTTIAVYAEKVSLRSTLRREILTSSRRFSRVFNFFSQRIRASEHSSRSSSLVSEDRWEERFAEMAGELSQQSSLLQETLREVSNLVSARRRRNNDPLDDVLSGNKRKILAEISATAFLASQVTEPRILTFGGGWEASPALLANMLNFIEGNTNPFILELGSGVSTLVIADALRRMNSGRLATLEHLPDYAGEALENLERWDLGQRVTVHCDALQRIETNGLVAQWYRLPAFEPHSLNAVLVDGPPGAFQKDSRLPAAYLLDEFIAPGGRVWIDDTERDDEKHLLQVWLKNPNYRLLERVTTMKPFAVIEKRKIDN